jgi:Leucine-rich repeat (LRR) protein
MLKTLVKEIEGLYNLETLECTDNKIEFAPLEIGNILSLKNFSLSNNKIAYLPPKILIAKFATSLLRR